MSTYELLVSDYKRRLIADALLRNKGNQCKAALDLGIHRNTLSRIMQKLEISKANYHVRRTIVPAIRMESAAHT